MNMRISWFGVLMRLIGALAVVLLSYNPTGYSLYHWALHDFTAITAMKDFPGHSCWSDGWCAFAQRSYLWALSALF